jgi:hypothetical protein
MSARRRLANSGDELVIFTSETGLVGLASAAEWGRRQRIAMNRFRGICARILRRCCPFAAAGIRVVFIPPGARVLVRGISAALQRECGFQEEVEQADFTWIVDSPDCFRDAVRFQNGVVVRLTRLSEGQSLRVLDFCSAEDRTTAPARRRRVMSP